MVIAAAIRVTLIKGRNSEIDSKRTKNIANASPTKGVLEDMNSISVHQLGQEDYQECQCYHQNHVIHAAVGFSIVIYCS